MLMIYKIFDIEKYIKKRKFTYTVQELKRIYLIKSK